MKYLLLGDDYKALYIEDDQQFYSVYFEKSEEEWLPGGTSLNDARCGYDPYEPEGSPYRYGGSSYIRTIEKISKEEAEEFIGREIDEEYIKILLKIK